MRGHRGVPQSHRGTLLATPRNSRNSFRITSLAGPHTLTLIESHPYKKQGRGVRSFTSLHSSVDSSKFRMLQVLCFHTLLSRAEVEGSQNDRGVGVPIFHFPFSIFGLWGLGGAHFPFSLFRLWSLGWGGADFRFSHFEFRSETVYSSTHFHELRD